jgi:hypothetical protein
MKILVTGGAGFIGSALTHFLVGKNYEVVTLDGLLDSTYSSTIKLDRWLELQKILKDVEFVQANLRISCGSTTNLGTGLTFTMPTTPVGTVNMYGAITNNKVGYPLTKFAESSGVVTVAGEEKKISYSDLTSIGTYQDLASSFVRYGRITGNSSHTPLKNNGLLLTNQYATINLTFTYEG